MSIHQRIPVVDLRAADMAGVMGEYDDPSDDWGLGLSTSLGLAEAIEEYPHLQCDHTRALCIQDGWRP